MRVLLLFLVGCAATTARVRDPQGHPLPTSALMDTDMNPARVHCEHGTYLVVEPPPPYLAGNHLATHQVKIVDAVALCAKIRTFD